MTTSDNISAIEAIEAIEKAMERATPGEWVAGWGNGLTGPTTPISGGVVGGKEWGYEPVSNGYETIATCHNQIAVGEMFVEAKGTAKANSAYIAACNPVAMSAILAEARKVEAMEREIAEKDARIAALEEALKPFVTEWADENGWTDVACQKDRIVDWFGPSDFRRARTLLNGGSDAQG